MKSWGTASSAYMSKSYEVNGCLIKCEINTGDVEWTEASYILPLKIFWIGLFILVCLLISRRIYKMLFSQTTNPPSEVDDENDFFQYDPTQLAQTQYSATQFAHTQNSPRQLAPTQNFPVQYASD